MRHRGYAVFQVTTNQGASRLICVGGISFGEGAKFESEMRRCCESWLHISFLGRFDQVESAGDIAEVLELLAQESTLLMGTDRSIDPRVRIHR